jgi:hypothetical protein
MEKDEISKGLSETDLADSCELEANVEGTCDENGAKLTQRCSPTVHGMSKGFTYFVREGDMIKIGSSIRPEDRISSLQTGTPRSLETLAIVSQDIADEFATHQLFAHLRVRGEWFRADQELLYFIEGVKADALAAVKPEPLAKAVERGLADLRKIHGFDSPAGHRCSNLIEQLANFRTAEGDQRMHLSRGIKQQMKELAELTAGSSQSLRL